MKLPVGIQFYSVRDEAQKDFRGTLQKIYDMGYEGVEFAGLYGNSPESVRDMCREIGIVPISCHVSLDEMMADPEKVIRDYQTIGCRYIAIPYLPEDRRYDAEKWPETEEFIKKFGKMCNEKRITLLYHNHDFEFKKINGEIGLDYMYRVIDAELLETELDLCWVNVGGENPAEYVMKYSGRAPVVHIKDFEMKGKEKPKKLYNLIGTKNENEKTDNGGDFQFKPIGYGVQDWEKILPACVKAGAEWDIVEQDEPDRGNTSLHAAEQSIETLKKINK